jgi:hypothetical protein
MDRRCWVLSALLLLYPSPFFLDVGEEGFELYIYIYIYICMYVCIINIIFFHNRGV